MIFANVQNLVIPDGEVVKISQGSTVLWERPGLPLAYQQVEYIQTDGTSYFDTGVLASSYPDGLEYVFWGNYTGGASGLTNEYMFGCLYGGKRSGNVAHTNVNEYNNINVYLGSASSYSCVLGSIGTKGKDFTLTAKGTSMNVPDFQILWNGNPFVQTDFASESYNTDMPSANIYLLACNLNGNPTSSTSGMFVGKLYSFTMADAAGTPLRAFVPCYRKSDGVIGLYDTVGGLFYANKGTGTLTKGEDV